MIGTQAKRANVNLWNNLIAPALKKSKEKVNIPAFFSEIQAKIIKANPERSRQKDLLEALSALKEDYKGVKTATLEILQKFKEGWAKFVPEKAYRGKPISGSFNEVKDIAADTARSRIYSSLGDDIKQAYFDYGNLKGIEELGQKAMTGGKLKGGFGGFWSAIKDMSLIPTATIGGQVVYKVGELGEFIGRPGMRFLRDLIPAPIDIGKDISGNKKSTTSPSQ